MLVPIAEHIGAIGVTPTTTGPAVRFAVTIQRTSGSATTDSGGTTDTLTNRGGAAEVLSHRDLHISLQPKMVSCAMTGSFQLRDYPGDMARLSCPKCGRAGQYKKQTLIERYGAYLRLPDLKNLIAKCRHRGMHDACMAQYDDLVTRR